MKIGFLCGSLRTGSINKQLENALIIRAKALGAEIGIIDLDQYDLPMFHGDIAAPEAVRTLINNIKDCDGIIITSPEYNGGLPPVLKNAIDWSSTVETGHITKPVYAIASATPGPMSGIMGMRQIAYILTRMGATLIPTQVGCGTASKAFNANGELIAEPASGLADKMLAGLTQCMASRAN